MKKQIVMMFLLIFLMGTSLTGASYMPVHKGEIEKISKNSVVIGDREFQLTDRTTYYRTSGRRVQVKDFIAGTEVLWTHNPELQIVEIGIVDSLMK